MIDNKFILNINSKELTQKKPKTTKEVGTISNDFKKILNEKSEKTTNDENSVNKKLDTKEPINNDEVKNPEDSNFEESIKEVIEIINDDENFQGNELDSEKLEEVVAILNQILNLPEIKSLLPVKLEDPMIMPISNGEANNDLLTSITEKDSMLFSNIKNDITLLNNINTNKDMVKNNTDNKEALNLVNNILEILNSKNIKGVLDSDNIQGFKNALEVLSENLFKQDTNLLSNVSVIQELTNEKNSGIKELKTTNVNSKTEVATGGLIDASTESEIKNILTELKSNLSSERVTEIKPIEINTGTANYGLTSEVTETSEEDKVLAKILGESESGSLNRQSNLFNRLNVRATDVIKEPMVVSKETMNTDIIKNVKFMMRNAVSELKVKIYPKELGEMTIKLLSEEGILKADIKATSKETYNLLNSNINEIKKSLEHQNIKIHEVNIGLYSDDTTYHSGENNHDEMFKNNENKQGKNSSREPEFLLDDLENDETLYEDSSVNLLA